MRLYLIDGSSYFYRAYYAIQHLSTSSGLPTNAIYGFTRMLLKVINQHQPDYLAVALDRKEPTFRHEAYAEYKATRPPMPDDLAVQLPYIRQVVEALRVPVVDMAGYEADDIIGTLARKAKEAGVKTVIVSADKDTFQLVDEDVLIFDDLRGKWYDRTAVEEKFGVPPEQLVDLFALVGDSSDNIPGVPGVGIKTAARLIKEFGSLEGVLAEIRRVKGRRVQQSLEQHASQARLSKQLVVVERYVPLELELEDLRPGEPDTERVVELFRELEFNSLIREFLPQMQVERECEVLQGMSALERVVEAAHQAGRLGFEFFAAEGRIWGLCLGFPEGRAVYVPLGGAGHEASGVQALPGFEKCCSSRQIASLAQVVEKVQGMFADSRVAKYAHDLKGQLAVLAGLGVEFSGPRFDTQLAAYLLEPNQREHGLEGLALRWLNRHIASFKDLLGRGAKARSFAEVPEEQAARFAGERVRGVVELVPKLEAELKEAGLWRLYAEIELPLVSVLAEMERSGVLLDVRVLEELKVKVCRQLEELTRRIYGLAGMEFNIDSPRQLGYVIFEKLGLPALRRTKTGYSTNNEVLQELAALHPLPASVLEYRKLQKLKNTYIDTLPRMVDPRSGRLHTTFNQTATATGRLSSSEPNLQNIPVRTELGREIRRAFVAPEGWRLLAADYSQIELRLLAHFSGDEELIRAFAEGEDVHQQTAVRVFGVAPEEVTPELRRRAKVINFGLIYGMSPYGLAKDLQVGQQEARRYIASYFERYHKVKEFLDQTILEAKRRGYVTTLFGRRRAIPELASKNANVRQLGERLAVNTPIQGSAADIIKLAMLATRRRLGKRARLVLQVHDELIFEVQADEVDEVGSIIRQEMEQVVELKVPLMVNLKWGKNWADVE